MQEPRPEHLLRLVRNLLEVLAPYEEELIETEQEAPDVARLRRAVSMAIAEACYWISDEGAGRDPWAPPKGDAAPPSR